jgi:MFS family permease
MTREEKKVILASSAGTIFEWYDFYLYGSLAAIIGAQFFTPFPEATRNVFALLAFAAGFIVRPFGALVFGMLGDLIGRKYTFLMTIMIMGLSTFIVGMLPSYLLGHRRADHPDRAAHVAGPGAWRRIWRCGGLCGRTRAA